MAFAGVDPESKLPLLSLTPQEQQCYAHFFSIADVDKDTYVSVKEAVAFLGLSEIDPAVLGQIWTLVNLNGLEKLNKNAFATALRLVSLAQAGKPVNMETLNATREFTIPKFKGIEAPQVALTQQQKAEFYQSWTTVTKASPDKMLGNEAFPFFSQSGLPTETLGKIWALADSKTGGFLDFSEFCIAMFYIKSAQARNPLPDSSAAIPASLIQSAKTAMTSAAPAAANPFQTNVVSGGSATGSTVGFSPFSSRVGAPANPFDSAPATAAPASPFGTASPFTGASGSPFSTTASFGGGAAFNPFGGSQVGTASPATNPFATNVITVDPWAVSAAEKTNYENMFGNYDVTKSGYIDAGVAVPILKQSNLDQPTLEKIWNLSDMDVDGKLTKLEFCVAMHLTQQRVKGRDVPLVLPPAVLASLGGPSAPVPAAAIPQPVGPSPQDLAMREQLTEKFKQKQQLVEQLRALQQANIDAANGIANVEHNIEAANKATKELNAVETKQTNHKQKLADLSPAAQQLKTELNEAKIKFELECKARDAQFKTQQIQNAQATTQLHEDSQNLDKLNAEVKAQRDMLKQTIASKQQQEKQHQEQQHKEQKEREQQQKAQEQAAKEAKKLEEQKEKEAQKAKEAAAKKAQQEAKKEAKKAEDLLKSGGGISPAPVVSSGGGSSYSYRDYLDDFGTKSLAADPSSVFVYGPNHPKFALGSFPSFPDYSQLFTIVGVPPPPTQAPQQPPTQPLLSSQPGPAPVPVTSSVPLTSSFPPTPAVPITTAPPPSKPSPQTDSTSSGSHDDSSSFDPEELEKMKQQLEDQRRAIEQQRNALQQQKKDLDATFNPFGTPTADPF